MSTAVVKSDADSKIKEKKPVKPKLGTGFIPPDGGWGWMVVLAAGCSNVSFHVVPRPVDYLTLIFIAVMHIPGSSTIRVAFPRTAS